MDGMTEAAKVFYTTNAERKRNGRGDRNKKRQGGRVIRFPSDHEKIMNSEVKEYQLGRPMNWNQYQELPEDLKEKYLRSIVEKYSATPKMLAEMFGRSPNVCAFETKRLKINANTQRGRVPAGIMEKWRAFQNEKIEQEEEQQNPAVEFASQQTEELFALLSKLQGSGAKITIEMIL